MEAVEIETIEGRKLKEETLSEISKVVLGRDKEAEILLVALLAQGHAILEGAPGVSKTLLAKSFAKCLGLDFRRIQFTPDMLPLDILGGFIFNVKERMFEFRRGPVFTNLLLADEINRAPPKVQSALLESMQERQVTVEGYTEKLPEPFMVIATQNPLEYQGVYPLPEGQLDRFMVRIKLGYPDPKTEVRIIQRNLEQLDLHEIRQVANRDTVKRCEEFVGRVKVSDELLGYLAAMAENTRKDQRLELPASPRAVVQLAQAARAVAFLDGRDYVLPDDIKSMAKYVLPHRMRVSREYTLKGADLDTDRVVDELLNEVIPPR
ncbi:MAG: MoxR family ATPase [Conexivisphaerales archaeon]